MIRAFYSGQEGLKAQQTSMDTIANNISNVSTTGFMSKDTGFSDLLYSSMVRPDEAGYDSLLMGNGVAVASIKTDTSFGSAVYTGGRYDCCPNGEGFFSVQDADGTIYYSRDGSFTVQQAGGTEYLMNRSGLYVLDAGGNRITADGGGNLSADPGIFTFSNPEVLLNAGGNLLSATQASGAAIVSNEGFRSGYLEGSNVNLADEMSNLIITERSFQLSTRVVSTADAIEDMVNSLRG